MPEEHKDAPDGAERAGDGRSRATGDPVQQVMAQAALLWAGVTEYARATLDGAGLAARNVGVRLVAWAVVGLLGTSFVILTVVYAVRGTAGGITILVGDRRWLGELITGAGGLVLFGTGSILGLRWRNARAHRRRAQAYAARQQELRVRYPPSNGAVDDSRAGSAADTPPQGGRQGGNPPGSGTDGPVRRGPVL